MAFVLCAASLVAPSSASAGNPVSTNIETRIVGGQPAGSIPWYTALYSGGFYCGASVIDAHWVITAAHCVAGRNTVSGIVNPPTIDTTGPVWSASGANIIINPSYDGSTEVYDYALIHVTGTTFTSSIPYTSTNPPLYTTENIYGYGTISSGGSDPLVLQAAQVSDLAGTSGSCGSYPPNEYLPTTMMCSGVVNGGVDTCQGDSGGPLTALGDVEKLVGLTSWGYGCGQAAYPGVYSRIATVASWIEATTGIAANGSSIASAGSPLPGPSGGGSNSGGGSSGGGGGGSGGGTETIVYDGGGESTPSFIDYAVEANRDLKLATRARKAFIRGRISYRLFSAAKRLAVSAAKDAVHAAQTPAELKYAKKVLKKAKAL